VKGDSKRRRGMVNSRVQTLSSPVRQGSEISRLYDVTRLLTCRLLGLCVCAFTMCSCIVTSWDYPIVGTQKATGLRNTVPLINCVTDQIMMPNIFGTATALRELLEEVRPSEDSSNGKKILHCQARLYQVPTDPPPGTAMPFWYYHLSAASLLTLPAYLTEEYGVVYTVFPPDRPPKEYEYRIQNAGIMWLGFIPVGWAFRWVDPRPAKAVEATYHQFLLDANRDGLLD